MTDERARLEQSIAALEAQRAAMGSEIIEPALTALRKQLGALGFAPPPPEEQRKQVTVLCANLPGLVNLAHRPEVGELWQRLDHILFSYGGRIQRQSQYEVLAVWDSGDEDPERAIRAVLAMQEEVHSSAESRLAAPKTRPASSAPAALYLRAGINTGMALLAPQLAPSQEYTVHGEVIEIADRLQNTAQQGDILVGHDAYRHVRGVFDVEVHPPLRIKGRKLPLQVYRVLRAKPRPFHLGSRGIEGLETRMVGRDAELQRLQQAYQHTQQTNQSQLITIVGDVGIGKSRLLYEFLVWLELNTDTYLFKGRAAPEMVDQTFSLLRSIFTFRFQINESNSLDVVRSKMVQGMAFQRSSLEQRAHFIGQLLGFDFKDSPYVKSLLGDPRQLRERALAYIEDYLRAVAARSPLVLIVEDIHWADDDSLDFLRRLPAAAAGLPVLIICAARPTLFDRRPGWGAPPAAARQLKWVSERMDLQPLSRQNILLLVDEILQKVQEIPDALREMIAGNSEGNPFYIEELVKMLIEDGVIFKGDQRWYVNPTRLMLARLPPTLVGILQTRFDSLGDKEKMVLQSASVLGRIFWDQALEYMRQPLPPPAPAGAPSDVTAALHTLAQREMIFQRETSSFEHVNEFSFKHALLREVIYASVPEADRLTHHLHAAEWLIAHSGERASEAAGMIAEHLERAGQNARAAAYLEQAGEHAFLVSAYRQALAFYERALRLVQASAPNAVPLAVRAGESLLNLGDYPRASQQLEQALALARQQADLRQMAAALDSLGVAAREQGLFEQSRSYLNEGLEITRKLEDPGRLAHILIEMGMLDIRQGNFDPARQCFSESQALYEQLGDRRGVALAINRLGVAARSLEDYEAARAYFAKSLEMCTALNDLTGMARASNNLGVMTRLAGQYAAAQNYFQECLKISGETGDRLGAAVALGNLGHTAAVQESYAAAHDYYRQALQTALEISAVPTALDSLVELAGVLLNTGHEAQAAEIVGQVSSHSSAAQDTRNNLIPLLEQLRSRLPAADLQEQLERGRQRTLTDLIEALNNLYDQ